MIDRNVYVDRKCNAADSISDSDFYIDLPRTSKEQATKGTLVDKKALVKGDLVFFSSPNSNGAIAHVGIFSEDGMFINATERNGVHYANINTAYWNEHYIKGMRIIEKL